VNRKQCVRERLLNHDALIQEPQAGAVESSAILLESAARGLDCSFGDEHLVSAKERKLHVNHHPPRVSSALVSRLVWTASQDHLPSVIDPDLGCQPCADPQAVVHVHRLQMSVDGSRP
jgi:hypothetical protein